MPPKITTSRPAYKFYSDQDLKDFYNAAGRLPRDTDPTLGRQFMMKMSKPPAKADPSAAWTDSVDTSLERIATGANPTAIDTTRAYLAGRMKAPVQPKPERPASVLADSSAARLLRGDTKGYFALHPKQPEGAPSYHIQQDQNGNTVGINPKTLEVRPIKGMEKSGNYTEKQYNQALKDRIAASAENVPPEIKERIDSKANDIIKGYEGQKKQELSIKVVDTLNRQYPPSAFKDYSHEGEDGNMYHSDGKEWRMIVPIQ